MQSGDFWGQVLTALSSTRVGFCSLVGDAGDAKRAITISIIMKKKEREGKGYYRNASMKNLLQSGQVLVAPVNPFRVKEN